VDIFHSPDVNLLLLHEYGGAHSSDDWCSAEYCNALRKPFYIIPVAIGPNFPSKSSTIKRFLAGQVSTYTGLPCRLLVADSIRYV
jgi:hypothetical protein